MARTLNNKPVLIPNLWFQPYSSNLFKMDAFLFHNSLQTAANGIPSHKTPMTRSLHRFEAVKLLSCQSHKPQSESALNSQEMP